MEEETKTKRKGISRRDLLIGAGGSACLLGIGSLKPLAMNSVIRPPGGQDEDWLISACLRCEKCIQACPKQVVKSAHIETGILNARTPTLNFDYNWCDYCVSTNAGVPLCVEACPTNALKLPEDASLRNVVIGKAVINAEWCLAYRMTGCRYCVDSCPYDAMRLSENNLPFVIYNLCNGCGKCESVCVTLENGSLISGTDDQAISIRPLDALPDLGVTYDAQAVYEVEETTEFYVEQYNNGEAHSVDYDTFWENAWDDTSVGDFQESQDSDG